MDNFIKETFCQGEYIWDYNLSWNTTTPRFTACFRHTIPIWIPAIFLWICAPFQIYYLHRYLEYRPIPKNCYNRLKFFAIFAIIAINAVRVLAAFDHFSATNTSIAGLIGSAINVATFILLQYLSHLHRLYGFHTSAITWLFTFLAIIFSAPSVYQFARFFAHEYDHARFEMAIFGAHFVALTFHFVLISFADHKIRFGERNRGLRIAPPTSDHRCDNSVHSTCPLASSGGGGDDYKKNSFSNDLTSNEWHETDDDSFANHSPSRSGPLPECPDQRASFVSLLSYTWLLPLISRGFRRTLTDADLWRLPNKDSSQFISRKFCSFDSPRSFRRFSTFATIRRCFGCLFLSGSAYKLGHDLLQFVSPQLLKIFIGFIASPAAAAEPSWHGYIYASSFFVVASVQSVLLNYYYHTMYSVGMRVRAGLIAAIYRKSFALSDRCHLNDRTSRRASRRRRRRRSSAGNNSKSKTTANTSGEIVNLMSVDASRLADTFLSINNIWSVPLQISLTIGFLWHELGASIIAGIAVLLALVPLNAWLSAYQRRFQVAAMRAKDERVKTITELLNGIRAIKLHCWEVPLVAQVSRIRTREIAQIRRIALLKAFTSFVWTCAPFAVTFVTFAVYVLSDDRNRLDAKKAFVSLALFELLRVPLTTIPELINAIVSATIAAGRLNRFLGMPDLQPYVKRSGGSAASTRFRGDDDEGTDEDFDPHHRQEKSGKEDISTTTAAAAKEYSITIERGTFAWQYTVTNLCATNPHLIPTLIAINLRVKKGSLVAIVGAVGSGKSSLLSAILGDMHRIDGSITVGRTETFAYVAQQAWIRNATVRDNILFGETYDAIRYAHVLEMCALKPDIAILPAGDRTEIGEKGINLSGGQKQRVSIARACYSAASVVLLDDPLSAVDSHVARHIFDHVLSNRTGSLRDRTRIVCTNQWSFLAEVDLIVVLAAGTISECGTYERLMAARGKFAELVRENSAENFPLLFDEDDTCIRSTTTQATVPADISSMINDNHRLQHSINHVKVDNNLDIDLNLDSGDLAAEAELTAASIQPQPPIACNASSSSSPLFGDESQFTLDSAPKCDESYRLIKSEKIATGNVTLATYFDYLRPFGSFWLAAVIAGYVGMQTASVGTNIWLAIWSNDATDHHHPHPHPHHHQQQQPPQQNTVHDRHSAEYYYLGSASYLANITTSLSSSFGGEHSSRDQRLLVYGLLGAAQASIFFAGAIAFAKGSVNSAAALHRALLSRIMRSPISFFDITPLGRIVNRFSKDIDVVDTNIPINLNGLLLSVLQVIATLTLICVNLPWFITLAIPIILLYYYIQKFYVPTARQLKRLESVTRSPIFSHFAESLAGVATIRAYGCAHRFIAESHRLVDANLRCYYPNFNANRWLAFWLKFCGNLIVLGAATFSVSARERFRAEPGFVGLIITYSLSVTQYLNWLVRQSSDLEANIVSVERIADYCHLPTEREWRRAANIDPRLPLDWPAKGEIEFRNFSLRYRAELEPILHRISFRVRARERVGIVGRTGAGKSSLALALFRIVEPAAGRIEIDGIDISRIGLHELRRQLSIIPQDPILFGGTIRVNLDPFGERTDAQLWQALAHAHLHSYVARLDAGLETIVAENGANLSVGQRQLICLGRALLRRTKILVLDEATAAIDLETDALIQRTIRAEFAHCTVLTIAHRLNTIMDSDRVLVLDRGSVQEFDSPAALLADANSRFYSLAKDAGIVA